MVWFNYIYNSRVKRNQAVIYDGKTEIATLDASGFENKEKFKKHVESVMNAYTYVKNIIDSNEPVKKYNPTTVPKFIHVSNADDTIVKLVYDRTMFAQLNLAGIRNIDLQLKYIYKVFYSFKRYSRMCC